MLLKIVILILTSFCGKAEFTDIGGLQMFQNPILIVAVLSDSTKKKIRPKATSFVNTNQSKFH